MLIYFRCRRCRNPLSVGFRQAGNPMICPRCRSEIIVPSASEMAPPPERSQLAAALPARSASEGRAASLAGASGWSRPEQSTSVPAPVEQAPQPPSAERSQHQRPWSRPVLAGAGLAALLLIACLITSRVWSRGELPADEPSLASESGWILAEENDAAAPLLALRAGIADQPAARPDNREDIPHALARALAREELEAQEEQPAEPMPEERPGPCPEQAAPRDETKARVFKRRSDASEEALRMELATANEVGLTRGDVAALGKAYAANFQLTAGQDMEPTVLLQIRPDFQLLPIRSGPACRLTVNATVNLHVLSQKLHQYLDRAIPKDAVGRRPGPVLLREVMRLEKRGQRPEWLRPEAIPTLTQMLMHEDGPVRIVLSDNTTTDPVNGGPGILSDTATVTIRNSAIVNNNSAGVGGGVFNFSTVR